MSRHKKNRPFRKTILKLKDKKKKSSSHNETCKKFCGNENQKDGSSDDTNQKKKADEITADRSRLTCRRYEEFHDSFINYDKILNFLGRTQKANPGSIDLVKIGNSTQGKPIYMVIITRSFCQSDSPKMATFITAGLNGENAIAVSNALYMIEYLAKNPNYIKIMDYYIIPCCNPDAYDNFIKTKENDNNTRVSKSGSNCNLTKKKSEMNILKSDKKDVKKDSKKADCDTKKGDEKRKRENSSEGTKNENLANAKRTRKDISRSNEYELKRARSCSPKSSKKVKSMFISPKNKKNENDTKKLAEAQHSQNAAEKNQNSPPVNLSLNFPVVLGLNDMRRIPTDSFLERIKLWKENYINNCPETRYIINVIYNYQFAIKLLICLQEDGESICYPYGFCAAISQETKDLTEIAKKGKCAINGRNFQYGSIHDIQGLTYGTLIDFLKVDKSSIKYTYVIQVHKKTPRYDEKGELGQIMRYGCEIMECIKRMSCAVYKDCTNMTGNKKVETESTKLGLDRKSRFR